MVNQCLRVNLSGFKILSLPNKPKYLVLKASEIIKILKMLGFNELRQKGSHKQLRNNKEKSTTIPVHKNRDVSRKLLKKILKEINIELDLFCKYI